jgi:hypothetical protein
VCLKVELVEGERRLVGLQGQVGMQRAVELALRRVAGPLRDEAP